MPRTLGVLRESRLKTASWCLAALLVTCLAPLSACTQTPQATHSSASAAATSSAGASAAVAPMPRAVGFRVANAADITWKGPFGSDHSDPSVAYFLLGSGFFRAPSSLSIGATTRKWVKAHPDAKVVPVVDFGVSPDGTRSVWVWLVDGDNNLNQELVRSGACARATMVAPDEKLMFDTRAKLLVTTAEYNKFEAALPQLEKLARRERLGIWK